MKNDFLRGESMNHKHTITVALLLAAVGFLTACGSPEPAKPADESKAVVNP
jgi:hypothetical protein